MQKLHSALLVSALLLGILFLFGCQSKELTSAKVYIQQDEWEKAEEQLKQAVALYPNDAEAHALLAEAFGRKSNYSEMAKELQATFDAGPQFKDRVIFLRDKYWVQNFNNGVNLVKAEKFDQALASFNNCPIIDPKRSDAYKNIAFVQVRLGSMDEAITNYQKVIELEPKDSKTMLQLGAIFYDKKEYKMCIELMDKILAIEPGNIDAISQKAFAYDSMGESDMAFQSYNEALAQKPNDPDILFNLGRLYYMKKDYDKAIAEFENVLQAVPDDYEATLNIGNAYLSIAEEHIKPLRDGKEFSEAEVKKIKDGANESYKKAIPYLEKAVALKDDSTVWTNLGIAYINAGMKEKGEAAFKKAEGIK